MKNKGFTLIEMLTVLVIIGLISLITITTVTKTLSKSKETLYNNQIKQIEAAARIWGTDNMDILPNDKDSSNICYYSDIDNCDKDYKQLIITLKTLQDGGYINKNIQNPKTKEEIDPNTEIIITRNGKKLDYEVSIDDESSFGGTYVKATSTDTHKGIVYMDPTNLKAECNASNSVSTTGTKTGCMKWYVIKESGTSDETVDVILDHNTTALVAWNSEGTNTEMKEVATQLATDTTGWTSGLNPRLITANEIAHIVGADSDSTIKWSSSKNYGTDDIENKSAWFYLDGGSNSDPTVYASGSNGWQKQVATSQGASNYKWLFDYTNGCTSYGCDTADSSTYGYWTSSPVSGSSRNAWRVGSNGSLDSYYVANDDHFGVRPVITINKSKLK